MSNDILDFIEDDRPSPIDVLVAAEVGEDDRVEVASALVQLLCGFVFEGRDCSAWPRRLWAVKYVLRPAQLPQNEQSVKGAAEVYGVSERGLYFLQSEAKKFFKASLCPGNTLCRFRSGRRFHTREGDK